MRLDDSGEGEFFVVDKYITPKEARKYLTKEYIEDEFPAWALTSRSLNKMPLGGYVHEKYKDVQWCVDLSSAPEGMVMTGFEVSWTDNFGNESGSGTLYASAAIIVTIPAYEERMAQMEKVPDKSFQSAFVRCIQGDVQEEQARMERVADKLATRCPGKRRNPHRGGMWWGGGMWDDDNDDMYGDDRVRYSDDDDDDDDGDEEGGGGGGGFMWW